jgi:hypothetical protein
MTKSIVNLLIPVGYTVLVGTINALYHIVYALKCLVLIAAGAINDSGHHRIEICEQALGQQVANDLGVGSELWKRILECFHIGASATKDNVPTRNLNAPRLKKSNKEEKSLAPSGGIIGSPRKVAGIPAKEIPNESSNESDGNLCKPRWHTTEFWILQAIVFGIAYVIGRQVPTAKVSHRAENQGGES